MATPSPWASFRSTVSPRRSVNRVTIGFLKVTRVCYAASRARINCRIYEITKFDAEGTTILSGMKLMKDGLTVTLNEKPAAAVIAYQRIK